MALNLAVLLLALFYLANAVLLLATSSSCQSRPYSKQNHQTTEGTNDIQMKVLKSIYRPKSSKRGYEIHETDSQQFVEMKEDEGGETGGQLGRPDDGAWVGIGKRSFKPYPSVGALSDMQSFFETLRNNLDYLETLPADERDVLLGKAPPAPVEREQVSRPSSSAAYLHALRSQRPSHKIRNFVDSSELRATHRHDPSLLWTGLGKRR